MNNNDNKNTQENDLVEILKRFNGRLTAIELYVKMLDTSLMKFISTVEILRDKKIVTEKEMNDKISEILKKGNELQDKMREGFLEILTDDDIGHA